MAVNCEDTIIYNAIGIMGPLNGNSFKICRDENGNLVNPDGTPFQSPKPQADCNPFVNPYCLQPKQQPYGNNPYATSLTQFILWLVVVIAVIILIQKFK